MSTSIYHTEQVHLLNRDCKKNEYSSEFKKKNLAFCECLWNLAFFSGLVLAKFDYLIKSKKWINKSGNGARLIQWEDATWRNCLCSYPGLPVSDTESQICLVFVGWSQLLRHLQWISVSMKGSNSSRILTSDEIVMWTPCIFKEKRSGVVFSFIRCFPLEVCGYCLFPCWLEDNVESAWWEFRVKSGGWMLT